MYKISEKKVQEIARQIVADNAVNRVFDCFQTVSNESLKNRILHEHREKIINTCEYILAGCPDSDRLYPSVTYGVEPNKTCRWNLGKYTDKVYGNYGLFIRIIPYVAPELQWYVEDEILDDRIQRLIQKK